MIKSFNNFLNESYEINDKPEFFSYTHYDIPKEKDIIDINEYNLSSKEIVNGFIYTIVGKGIMSRENKEKIIISIKMMCDMYPHNEEYKKALIEAKNIKSK